MSPNCNYLQVDMWQLSAVTVGRSYSCLWWQFAEITVNILHLSADPSYLHCNGTKVQQPKMRYQLICGLMSANPRGNKLLHSTWSISPRLKRHPFPRWVWSGVFLFLCQCNCWCWVVQLTLCRILCVARPELSCKIAHSCIGCTFHTWFSRLPGISCANVH